VRDKKEKMQISESKIMEEIVDQGKAFSQRLFKRAEEGFKGSVHEASTKGELKQCLEKGGFTRINFCTMENSGKHCAEKLKEEFSADVRGTRFDRNETPKSNCLICGKKATAVVYVGRQY